MTARREWHDTLKEHASGPWTPVIVCALVATLPLFVCLDDCKPVATSRQGAAEALRLIADWTKWMAAIQTAALGFLAAAVLSKDYLGGKVLSRMHVAFARGALLFLAAALAVSAWTLSSLPSQVLRLHAERVDTVRVVGGTGDTAAVLLGSGGSLRLTVQAGDSLTVSARSLDSATVAARFDVYRAPVYGWQEAAHNRRQRARFTLGYLLVVKHWYWALGLFCVAGLGVALHCDPPGREASRAVFE